MSRCGLSGGGTDDVDLAATQWVRKTAPHATPLIDVERTFECVRPGLFKIGLQIFLLRFVHVTASLPSGAQQAEAAGTASDLTFEVTGRCVAKSTATPTPPPTPPPATPTPTSNLYDGIPELLGTGMVFLASFTDGTCDRFPPAYEQPLEISVSGGGSGPLVGLLLTQGTHVNSGDLNTITGDASLVEPGVEHYDIHFEFAGASGVVFSGLYTFDASGGCTWQVSGTPG